MALILPLALIALCFAAGGEDWRERFLRGVVLLGAALVWITEILGALHNLAHTPVSVGWTLIALIAAGLALRRRKAFRLPRWPLRWIDSGIVVSITVVLVILAWIALLSPPNSADAMAYHLPRVVYWVQQRSVNFFPTPYLNQIMLQPVAEYFMLHTYLLSGGDHFVNLVQWFGCLTSVIAVSLIASRLGAGLRGQILTALFCATLPNGILQATGAKNDYLLAAWLAIAAGFLLRSETRVDFVFAALALALAAGTKATAYLYAPGLVLAMAMITWKRWRPNLAFAMPAMVTCLLLIDGPQFARNLALSGSPMGFDSAQGDGFFRWRNDKLGVRTMVSTLLRNTSEQLGGASERWNRLVYTSVVRLHVAIGADPNDPATTWPWTRFQPPRHTNHEADTPNRWHLLILTLCCMVLVWNVSRGRPPDLAWYTAGLVTGFLLFCFYLRWQLYLTRLFLPLFVLASPIAGVLIERMRPKVLQVLLCLFLLNNSRPFLFQNWVRSLKEPHSLLRTSRESAYFNDMSQWNEAPSYFEAVDRVARSGCSLIGIDATEFQLEYPFEALLLARNPLARFVHTGVTNASTRYQRPDQPQPCAVLCLNCAGNAVKIELYRSFGDPQQVGEFLLFVSQPVIH